MLNAHNYKNLLCFFLFLSCCWSRWDLCVREVPGYQQDTGKYHVLYNIYIDKYYIYIAYIMNVYANYKSNNNIWSLSVVNRNYPCVQSNTAMFASILQSSLTGISTRETHLVSCVIIDEGVTLIKYCRDQPPLFMVKTSITAASPRAKIHFLLFFSLLCKNFTNESNWTLNLYCNTKWFIKFCVKSYHILRETDNLSKTSA